jgi:predicted chitinase
MKHKLKTGGILALALFLVYLYGCQKEELEIEQPIPTKGIPFEVEVPQVESYFVAESSKGKVIDKLFKALGYTTRTGGNVTESYETGIGTILTDEILAVQDVFGTKYTFKLDHPEKDFYTFFNLVMVDKGEEVVVLLKKYIMTEEFANLYRSDQKTVDDFDGSVATTLLTNPCLCEFPNEGEPEIVYPGDYTPGGSGGGGTVAGSGPSGPVGGGTGGTTHCFLISFTMTHTITYTNGNSHTKTKRYTLDTCTGIITVNNKGTKTSKDGNNQTETYNENDCCSFGAIGIMDGSNTDDDCNTSKEDLKKLFPNASDANLELLANVINAKGKDFGINNKEKLQHFLSQAGHEVGEFTGGIGRTENTSYTTKARILKVFGKYFSETDTITKRKPDNYVNNPSALANYVYCCRMGNGTEESGDGYKYRGRGIFQLTGKTNYSNFQNYYNSKYNPDKDFLNNPELLKTNDTIAIISAMWFYQKNVMNTVVIDSTTTVKKITKKINGGINGLSHRESIFNVAKDSINCI